MCDLLSGFFFSGNLQAFTESIMTQALTDPMGFQYLPLLLKRITSPSRMTNWLFTSLTDEDIKAIIDLSKDERIGEKVYRFGIILFNFVLSCVPVWR